MGRPARQRIIRRTALLACFLTLAPSSVLALQQIDGALSADDAARCERARALQRAGHYGDAGEIYYQILKTTSAPYTHVAVAAGLNNLADACQAAHRYEQAEPLYDAALEIWSNHLGRDHVLVAAALSNLGLLHQVQREDGEAERLYMESLSILEGSHDPGKLVTALSNFASLRRLQGRNGEAEELYGRALCIIETEFGSDHPRMATGLNNLGAVYSCQGRYREAGELYQRALTIWARTDAPDQAAVSAGLNNLGELYFRQARYAEAERFLRDSFLMREKLFGPHHPELATSLRSYALVLRKLNRDQEARLAEARAKDLSRSKIDDRRAHTIDIRDLQLVGSRNR
jgi:tetratricopeptide (TPR) repeat protein